nr:MAG TPA: hypothetical protein [Bacteriophage sp.]
MDFRNRKSATNKSTSKRTSKTNKTFVKLSEVEGALQIEDGAMWLKSGKYDAPSVSIEIEPGVILSDWSRKITLRHCDLVVEENEKGYPELIISGDSGDMPF